VMTPLSFSNISAFSLSNSPRKEVLIDPLHVDDEQSRHVPSLTPKNKVVYVGFAADIVHHGHINIIHVATSLGYVIVGLLTDEAIKSYKRETIIKFEDRKTVVEAIRGVGEVVAQYTHDYSDNLLRFKPDYVVHGTDWRAGTQAKVRQKCIDLIATWGGQLVEPEYTKDISTTDIIQQCYEYERVRKRSLELPPAATEDYKIDFVTKDIMSALERGRPLVYLGVATDFIHHGHVHIIREAAKFGKVVVGLLTDEAVQTYKRKPVVAFEHRVTIFKSLRGVSWVIPQFTLSYAANLRALRPDFVVHGDDWRQGTQKSIREEVLRVLLEWGGKLIEPPYTPISATADSISEACYNCVVDGLRQTAAAIASVAAHS